MSSPHLVNPDEELRRFKEISRKVRERIGHDPEKAKDFLVKAGIAERSENHRNGIQLAPAFRSD